MPQICTPIARDQQIAVIRDLDQAATLSNDFLLLIGVVLAVGMSALLGLLVSTGSLNQSS